MKISRNETKKEEKMEQEKERKGKGKGKAIPVQAWTGYLRVPGC